MIWLCVPSPIVDINSAVTAAGMQWHDHRHCTECVSTIIAHAQNTCSAYCLPD